MNPQCRECRRTHGMVVDLESTSSGLRRGMMWQNPVEPMRTIFEAAMFFSLSLMLPPYPAAQAPPPAAPPLPAQTPVVRPPTVSVQEGRDHLIKQVDAPYPPIAAAAHVAGTVVVGVEISADGNVTQALVLGGPEMLRAAAIEAVRQYRYRPFQINGTAAIVRTAVQVEFHLGRSKSG